MKKNTISFHWSFFVAVIVLLLNDHILKDTFHNWWTGKLSDFAGLYFFPALLSLALKLNRRWSILAVYIFTALIFIAMNIPSLAAAVNSEFAPLFRVWPDLTDFVALITLPLSWFVLHKIKLNKNNILKNLAVALAIPATLFTVVDYPGEENTEYTSDVCELVPFDSGYEKAEVLMVSGEPMILRAVTADNRIALYLLGSNEGNHVYNSERDVYELEYQKYFYKSLYYSDGLTSFVWDTIETSVSVAATPEDGFDSPSDVTLDSLEENIFVLDANRLRRFSIEVDPPFVWSVDWPTLFPGEELLEIEYGNQLSALAQDTTTGEYTVYFFDDDGNLDGSKQIDIDPVQSESGRDVEEMITYKQQGDRIYLLEQLSKNYTEEDQIFFLEYLNDAGEFQSGVFFYEAENFGFMPEEVYEFGLPVTEEYPLCVDGRQRNYEGSPTLLDADLHRVTRISDLE